MTTRTIPERLLVAASGRTTRIIDYRAYAWLHGLDGIAELQPEFSVPHGAWRRGPYDHQRRRIDDLEIVEIEGLLVASVQQTLADMCAVVDLDIVERAAESALRRDLVDELALRDFADTWAMYRHGAPGLREVLRRRRHGEPPTGSDLETLNLQAWRLDPRIPRPERQWPISDKSGEFVAFADFGFPPRLFVVEDDGLETHGKTKEQQQYDLNRQNRISDAGYDFRRFTHADVTRRPKYVCRETLRGLMAAPFARKPLQV
jgi:very-short-patch-repair endonuclease